MSTSGVRDRPGDFVQSLERGLSVLRVFSADHATLTLSDVARLAGLTRATARRILLTLESLGYVSSDARLFELTPKVLDLGYAYVSSLKVADIAQPFMEALSERVHESVSASVLDGPDIIYVARVPTKRIMTVSLAIGSRLPAEMTSMGRVLLSELPEPQLEAFLDTAQLRPRTAYTITTTEALRAEIGRVREMGWALLDQELEVGVRSVATAIRDSRGRAAAAINVSGHAGRVTLKELRGEFLQLLLAAAADISAQLAKR